MKLRIISGFFLTKKNNFNKLTQKRKTNKFVSSVYFRVNYKRGVREYREPQRYQPLQKFRRHLHALNKTRVWASILSFTTLLACQYRLRQSQNHIIFLFKQFPVITNASSYGRGTNSDSSYELTRLLYKVQYCVNKSFYINFCGLYTNLTQILHSFILQSDSNSGSLIYLYLFHAPQMHPEL